MAQDAPHAPAILKGEDLARHEIIAQLRAHQDLIFNFARAYYQSPYTFRSTRVLGYLACKIPFDLWTLQDLMTQYRFRTVVETGTAGGGTALWYAILMDALAIDDGRVISIDVDPDEALARPHHPRITYITGSSVDPEIVAKAEDMFAHDMIGRGPLLVNLDSDHRAPHVLAELNLWAPLLYVNDWLVVEDTNGAPVIEGPDGPEMVEGPFAAVMEYLARHDGEFLRDVVCERHLLTMNPHGWLMRVRPYREG